MGLIGQNSTFSDHGHVAYKFKGNQELSSIVANILLSDPYPTTLPTPTLGIWSLGQKQLFQNMVVLHIKLKRITNAKKTVANILSQTPRPWEWGQ